MDQSQVAADFLAAVEEFNRQAHAMGYADIENYYWYHTVNLPHGLVTPGLYDFRQTYPRFRFPEEMRGLRVLDVGSATGFFAFEFEKRGAYVVSVELPSLYALDRFPGQNIEQTIEKIGQMIVPKELGTFNGYVKKYTAEQLYYYLLEGPFSFCARLIGSHVERCYASVYDLTEENTGGNFDLVFMGDVLVHTLNPLQALASAAALCRGTLVFSQVIPEAPDDQAAFRYVGGDSPDSDEVSWWVPNMPAVVQILKKLGFRKVEEVGHHAGILRPSGYEFDRAILHAVR